MSHRISRRSMLHSSAGAVILARLAQTQAMAQTAVPVPARPQIPDTEWRNYANDLAYTRYAPLDQINGENFSSLQVAWRFETANLGGREEFNLQATPLLIKGRLFSVAGTRRDVVSLDAATGEQLWTYRMDEGERARHSPRQLSGRGVAYWSDGDEERILYVTVGYRLVSLDAKTGIPDPNFGNHGVVDLKENDDQEMDPLTADVGLHSAPTVAKGVVIIGAAHTAGNVPKTRYNAKGYVRGFDCRTGKRLWIFHTIPQKGEVGYDSWTVPGQAEKAGNQGDWAQIAADEELGLAYLGVELATGDQMGIYRSGNALFGESIVAVDILTGKYKWHYQMVHHGVWDYDVCAAAILCDIPHNGKIIKALAQPTKQSFLYVLDRETGKPVWPIPEKPVPKGDVPGETYSPTQPIPSKPPAYDRQGVTVDDLIDFTPALRARALEIVKYYRMGPVYTPPTLAHEGGPFGTLNLPGYIGGSNWPGAAYDPETHMVYLYSQTNLLTVGSIIPNPNKAASDFDYIHANLGEVPRTPGAPPTWRWSPRRGAPPNRIRDRRVPATPMCLDSR